MVRAPLDGNAGGCATLQIRTPQDLLGVSGWNSTKTQQAAQYQNTQNPAHSETAPAFLSSLPPEVCRKTRVSSSRNLVFGSNY